jgi:hypothetical protein
MMPSLRELGAYGWEQVLGHTEVIPVEGAVRLRRVVAGWFRNVTRSLGISFGNCATVREPSI